MNKKTLLMISVLAATSVAAQKSANPLLRPRPVNALTQEILQRQSTPQALNKGTVVSERLVGMGSLYLGLPDTANYKYSGARGSALNNAIMDTYMDPGFSRQGGQYMPVPLSVGRNTPSLMYDTGYYYSDIGGGDFLESHVSRTYGANSLTHIQKLNASFSPYIIVQRTKDEHTYNTAGDVIFTKSSFDSTMNQNGPWLPSSNTYYKYNNGRPSQDSSENTFSPPTTPAVNVLYSYDGQGNLTSAISQSWSGGWQDAVRDYYTYTAANKLAAHRQQQMDGSLTWQDVVLDSFAYSGNNIIRTVNFQKDLSTWMWQDGYLELRYYNAAGNMDSSLTNSITTGGIVLVDKRKYTYTALGHFNKLTVYEYNGTSYNTTPDGTVQFYYETFNTNGISNVNSGKQLDVRIYPVPAKDLLHVAFKTHQNGAITVRILNMAGQVMQQSQLIGSNEAIPVQGLAAGNYIAEISTSEGSRSLQFVK